LRIVLSYYYYSKWLSDNSNAQGSGIAFLSIEGNSQLSFVRFIPAGILSLCNGHSHFFNINRRLKWKQWLLFYHLL
jgi:hypothetical protein